MAFVTYFYNVHLPSSVECKIEGVKSALFKLRWKSVEECWYMHSGSVAECCVCHVIYNVHQLSFAECKTKGAKSTKCAHMKILLEILIHTYMQGLLLTVVFAIGFSFLLQMAPEINGVRSGVLSGFYAAPHPPVNQWHHITLLHLVDFTWTWTDSRFRSGLVEVYQVRVGLTLKWNFEFPCNTLHRINCK